MMRRMIERYKGFRCARMGLPIGCAGMVAGVEVDAKDKAAGEIKAVWRWIKRRI